MILTLRSLLGLDALYDPPRPMVSAATLDVPSATSTPNAEPQQGASTARTTPAPTAASDVLTEYSMDSPDSYSAATRQSVHHDVEESASATAAMESQTPDLSLATQDEASSGTAGSTMADGETSSSHIALPESQTPDLVSDLQSDTSTTTAGSPLASDASTDTQSEGASASSTVTSTGISLFTAIENHAAVVLSLLLSFIAW